MRRPLAIVLLMITLWLAGCAAEVITSQPAPPAAPPRHMGQVLGPDGHPAAGVLVQAYVVSDLGGRSGVRGAGQQTRTDHEGHFDLTAPEEAILNVEAVLSDDLKAIVLGVPGSARDLRLHLAHAGSIAGRVTAPEQPEISNLQGVDVYVPGSSLLAKTDAAGFFVLSHVPVGSFTLVASRLGLGTASKSGVSVTSRTTTQADELALSLRLPAIATVVPDQGAPGETITLTGDNFGASSGEILQVIFTHAPATQVERIDDRTIKVVVPEGAGTGNLIVNAGGFMSNGMTFRTYARIAIEPGNMWLVPGATQSCEVAVLDTAGLRVSHPLVTWSVTGQAVAYEGGVVTARAVGDAWLQATSGMLASRRTLHVISRYPMVSTLPAPGPEDPLVSATDVLAEPGGDLILVDNSGGRILRYSVSTRAFTILAGSGEAATRDGVGTAAAFSNPDRVARDPENGDLYVAEFSSNAIRRVQPDGTVTTLAATQPGYMDGPLTVARFNGISSLAVGPNHVLYVGDYRNRCVRMIRDGVVSTLAGDGISGFRDGTGRFARFHSPEAMAVDAAGNVIVADSGNYNVRRITPAGKVTTLAGSDAGQRGRLDGTGTEALFDQPYGLALDSLGRVLVTEIMSNHLRMIEPDGTVTTLVGSGGLGYGDGPGPEAQLASPMSVTVAPDGTLYILDWSQDRIRKVVP